jgi:hypothetical protein
MGATRPQSRQSLARVRRHRPGLLHGRGDAVDRDTCSNVNVWGWLGPWALVVDLGRIEQLSRRNSSRDGQQTDRGEHSDALAPGQTRSGVGMRPDSAQQVDAERVAELLDRRESLFGSFVVHVRVSSAN